MKRYSSAFGVWWDDYTQGEAFSIGKRRWSSVELARDYGWRGIIAARHAAAALASRGIRSLEQLSRTDPDTLRTAGRHVERSETIGDHAIKLLELILVGANLLTPLWQESMENRARGVVVKRTSSSVSKNRRSRVETKNGQTPLTV